MLRTEDGAVSVETRKQYKYVILQIDTSELHRVYDNML